MNKIYGIGIAILILLVMVGESMAKNMTVDTTNNSNMSKIEPQNYGWPELKITAKSVEPSQVKPETAAMLNITVSEIRGDDWAKDVKVYVDLLDEPRGVNFSDTGTNHSERYLGYIGEYGSTKTSFAFNVSDKALFGNRTVKIKVEWYETGGFNWFTYGPYYEYSYIDFTVLNPYDEIVDEGITTIPYMTYLVLHDPSGDGSYSYIEKDRQFTIGSQFDLGSSKKTEIETNIGLWGVGLDYAKTVSLSSSSSDSVDINFKTIDRIETSADAGGPGYGDVFYGERWDIHYKFINRSTWLGYDKQYRTSVGGKNNIIIGNGNGVIRTLSSSAIPNTSITVTLNVIVGQSRYYSIDEQVPSGWEIVGASNGGDYISIPGHVKWTVTENATDAILTYNVLVPSNINGIYSFSGIYRFEGLLLLNIIGDNKITIDDIIPIVVKREISKNRTIPGSSFTVTLSINTGQDSEIKNLNIVDMLPIEWDVTSWNVVPSQNWHCFFIGKRCIQWNIDVNDIKSITYNVTIPMSANENIQPISGDTWADVKLGRYKLIDYNRIYQYYIIRSSEFMKPGYWIDQNVEEPWRSQMLNLDIGFDNMIDGNESKKVEYERDLNYIATNSPISFSNSTTITNSSKSTFTMDVNETVAVNWGLNIIGISFGGKVKTSSSIYVGHMNYTKNEQKVESGYTIKDHDVLFGDTINTRIYYDKIFGTYLFITDTNNSYTINPREPWTKSPLNISPTSGRIGDDFKFLTNMRKDLNKAEVQIQQPDENTIFTLELFDDGAHGDSVSNDGIYGNIWNSVAAYGNYYVDILAWDSQNQLNKADNVATFNVYRISSMINSILLDNQTVTVGDNIRVTVNVTDNVGIVSVTANDISLVNQGGDIWNGTIVALQGLNYVNVSVTDAAGNITWNNSTIYTGTNISINGTIVGTVTNVSSGTAITGANVTADNLRITTNTTGAYTISIAAGTYTVVASATGYNSSSTNITVVPGETVIQNFSLVHASPITDPDVAAYDTDHDGIISKSEAVQSAVDYFNNLITKVWAVKVVVAYFSPLS